MPSKINDENKRVLDELLHNYAGLLTEAVRANFNAMAERPDLLRSVAYVLASLSHANLLTGALAQANFNAVVRHHNPCNLASSLKIFHNAGLLTGDAGQANFNVVVGTQDPRRIDHAPEVLHKAGLLTGGGAQANFNAVAGHQDPFKVIDALKRLNKAGLLTGETAQANRNAVSGHQDPCSVADALISLSHTGLLAGETAEANFNAVVGHPDPDGLANALCALDRAHLLIGASAQANFNIAVITHTTIMSCDIWCRIPAHSITQRRFNTMTRICEENRENVPEGQRLFIDYINREILRIDVPPVEAGAARAFNPVSGLINTGVDVPLNAANMAELESMVANVTPHEGAAAHASQDRFFNTPVSSVRAPADISAPGEGSPKP